MLYRALPDLPPPTEADLDTAATAAAEVAIERQERHLRILARLSDLAMNLAEALARKAEAQIEAAAPEEAPAESKDANTGFSKMAQTVRRTVALEARIAAGVKAARDSLSTERTARRAKGDEAHKAAKDEAIIYGLHDAYAASTPQAEYEERVENLMEDTREHLRDADEFRGYLDRPVGETVAKLCAAVGLDPDACVQEEDGAWRIRRPPTEFELNCARHSLPFMGRDRRQRRQGGAPPANPPTFLTPPEPHPDRFAICPSP